MVDSGASHTVIGHDMVKAVEPTGRKPGVSYQLADGSRVPHMGEKSFRAYTDGGLLRNVVAQVTDVHKPLFSVGRMVKAGNRVVFDDEGSYVEHKESGEWVPLDEQGGVYTMKLWVPRDQKCPF